MGVSVIREARRANCCVAGSGWRAPASPASATFSSRTGSPALSAETVRADDGAATADERDGATNDATKTAPRRQSILLWGDRRLAGEAAAWMSKVTGAG